jgi:hypothetical protein
MHHEIATDHRQAAVAALEAHVLGLPSASTMASASLECVGIGTANGRGCAPLTITHWRGSSRPPSGYWRHQRT